MQCKPAPKASQRADQIASGLCECAAAVVALDKKTATLSDTSSVFEAHLEAMQRAYNQAFTCLTPMLNEIGPVAPAEIPEIQKALTPKCPELAQNKELMVELICR